MDIDEAVLDPAAVEPWRLGGEDERSLTVVLSTRMGELEGLRLRLLADIDRRGEGVATGASSTAAWFAGATRTTPGAAGRLVALACALSRWGRVAAILDEGRISADHAREAIRFLEQLPADLPAEGAAACEEFLVAVAVGGDVREIGRRGRELLESVRAESLEDVEERAHRHRELTIGSTPVDGLVTVKGRLTTEDAETVKTALSPLAAPRPAQDGTPDPRSASQRTADALAELARHSLDAGRLPTEGTVRPHVAVTVDAERLATGTGPLAHLTHLGAISDAAVRRLACDSELTPMTLDANLVPLDVGRTTRLVTGGLRRALFARDRGCAFPGCGRPPGWTEAHHIVFWADGGDTALTNLVLLCGHHHRVIHHHGWEVHIGADGHPWFVAPAWIDPERQPRPSHARRAAPQLPTAA